MHRQGRIPPNAFDDVQRMSRFSVSSKSSQMIYFSILHDDYGLEYQHPLCTFATFTKPQYKIANRGSAETPIAPDGYHS